MLDNKTLLMAGTTAVSLGAIVIAVGALVFATAPGPENSQAPVPPIIQPATASADLDQRIESFLMENPDVFVRAFEKASAYREQEEARRRSEALEDLAPDTFDNLASIELGNPDGDVTLVEFYDFNCSFCKRAAGDTRVLKSGDPNLRIIAVDMPVLGQGSFDAHRVTLAAKRQLDNEKMAELFYLLLDHQGQADGDTAIGYATDLGADETTLRADMNDPAIAADIQSNLELARRLGITGTPTWIVGGEIIVGAVGVQPLERAVSNTRSCGSSRC